MILKVHGGTAPGTSDSLCHTCRRATVVRGARLSEEVIECGWLDKHTRITFAVKSCSKYSDATIPSLDDMEDIAWVLRTDPKRNQIGFVAPDTERIPRVRRFGD